MCHLRDCVKTMGNSTIKIEPQLNSFFKVESMKMNKHILKTIETVYPHKMSVNLANLYLENNPVLLNP